MLPPNIHHYFTHALLSQPNTPMALMGLKVNSSNQTFKRLCYWSQLNFNLYQGKLFEDDNYKMADNYQIDLNAAKNTKLFQKFIQSKSQASNPPRIPQQTHKLTPHRNETEDQKAHRPTETRRIEAKPVYHPSINSIEMQTQPQGQGNYQSQGYKENSIRKNQNYVRHTESYQRPNQSVKQCEYTKYKSNQTYPATRRLQDQNKHLDENDYKRRYQRLQQRYDDLKRCTESQNKNRKRQLNEWQEEIEQIKEKLFEVRGKQDTLLIQNGRLKDKLQHELQNKIAIEQENKEYKFRIEELEDMMQGKENQIKKKNDQMLHWKQQNETLKEQLNELQLINQQMRHQIDMAESQICILRKEKTNKEQLFEEMRNDLADLVEENNLAKDQIYLLTTKLYHMEQENQILRADIKRLKESALDLESYSQHTLQHERNIRTNNRQAGKRGHPNMQRGNYEQEKGYAAIMEISGDKKRRRGEFARQRATANKSGWIQEQPTIENLSQGDRNRNASMMVRPERQSKTRRIEEISEELQKIRDMKIMNGPLRRKKIDLERELEQLQKPE